MYKQKGNKIGIVGTKETKYTGKSKQINTELN